MSNANALALNPIVGSLAEKVQAYDQMASAIANSQVVPGYDTIGKVKAACWLADALGVHPTIFMSGVHAIEFPSSSGGKRLALQPKWEFEHALLLARLPGYRMSEVESTAETCTIEFQATGVAAFRVTYTMKDADKQGLSGKNPNYKTSPKEMLWKQAFHRGAKRVGAHVLMALPPALGMDVDDVEREPSSAEVVEEDPAAVLDRVVEAGGGQPKPADGAGAPPEIVNHRARLGKKVRDVWRLKSNQFTEVLERINIAKTQMDGEDSTFKKLDEIGDVDAQRLWEWLDAKYPNGTRESAGSGATEVVAASTEAAPADDAPQPEDDDAPPAEEGSMIQNPDLDGSWEGFMRTVMKAAKATGNKIVKPSPPPKEKMLWFTALTAFQSLGYESSVKLTDANGGLVVSPAELVRLGQALYETYNLVGDAVVPPRPASHSNRREAVTS